MNKKILIESIKKNKITVLFFLMLFSYILLVFRNAFKVEFYVDDYFFLKIGHANDLASFLNFFSPFKNYFFRPIPTELFYFLINIFNKNLFISHLLPFIVYFIGLIYLYKVSLNISKSKNFSYLFTFIYGINFTHIFQIYQFNTFQEICLFTFMISSFYFFLTKKYFTSILLFIFALMSKESAILFIFPVIFYKLLKDRLFDKKTIIYLFSIAIITFVFFFIFKISTSQVMQIDTYKINFSPKLLINNTVWYMLWSLGVPNFVPNYVQSILLKPLPDFWNLFNTLEIKQYFYLLILYYFVLFPTFIITLINSRNKAYKYLSLLLILFTFFLLFISPTVPIIHRWMVRLTLPMIFVSCINTTIIYLAYKKGGFLKFISIFLLILYIVMNSLGVKIHESSGLFLLNTETIKNTKAFFSENINQMKKFDTIYFVDSSKEAFGGSEELKNLLGGDYFMYAYYPNLNKKIIYGHDRKIIPNHSFAIYSNDILKW